MYGYSPKAEVEYYDKSIGSGAASSGGIGFEGVNLPKIQGHIDVSKESSIEYASRFKDLDIRTASATRSIGASDANTLEDEPTPPHLDGRQWSAYVNHIGVQAATKAQDVGPGWLARGFQEYFKPAAADFGGGHSDQYYRLSEFPDAARNYNPEVSLLFEADDTHTEGYSFFLVSLRSKAVAYDAFSFNSIVNPFTAPNANYGAIGGDRFGAVARYPQISSATPGLFGSESTPGQLNFILRMDWAHGKIDGLNSTDTQGYPFDKKNCENAIQEAYAPFPYQEVTSISGGVQTVKVVNPADKKSKYHWAFTREDHKNLNLEDICKGPNGFAGDENLPNLFTKDVNRGSR
ncbi:hypothetical protein [Streptomyces sp. NPDC057686]|uniref:hypothetical protein n=1 Tax=Streptomyces sp. NPDC057686 TaxID=3346212 RepID=UPI0036BC3917